jgi:hypothetical protein
VREGREVFDQYREGIAFDIEWTGGHDITDNKGAWRSIEGGGLLVHQAFQNTTGGDQYRHSTAGICEWQDLTLVGALHEGRTFVQKWYMEMLKEGTPDKVFKNATLSIKDRKGTVVQTINFTECFITAYSLCALNGDDENVMAHETVVICVGKCNLLD